MYLAVYELAQSLGHKTRSCSFEDKLEFGELRRPSTEDHFDKLRLHCAYFDLGDTAIGLYMV